MENAYRDFGGRRGDSGNRESRNRDSRDWRSADTYNRSYRNDVREYPSHEAYQGRGPLRSHLRCRDIMTRDVVTCFVNTPLQDIARLMREQDIGALPVINQEGILEGIVTDRDLVVKGLTTNSDDTALKAQDCMSTDLYVAQKNDRVVDVIREMGDHQIRRVPVVDSRNRLVGIVAVADLATQTSRDRELGDAFEEISKPKTWFDRVARWLGF